MVIARSEPHCSPRQVTAFVRVLMTTSAQSRSNALPRSVGPQIARLLPIPARRAVLIVFAAVFNASPVCFGLFGVQISSRFTGRLGGPSSSGVPRSSGKLRLNVIVFETQPI